MKSIKPGRGPSMMGGISSVAAVLFGVIWTFWLQVQAVEYLHYSDLFSFFWQFPVLCIISKMQQVKTDILNMIYAMQMKSLIRLTDISKAKTAKKRQ